MRRSSWRLPAVLVLAVSAAAPAQTSLERFERRLEQIERDTRLTIDSEVPAGQRVLFDYGAFYTFSFAAIDDTLQKTHILRQHDFNAYARLNLDGVHEFFFRGSATYRDFYTWREDRSSFLILVICHSLRASTKGSRSNWIHHPSSSPT